MSIRVQQNASYDLNDIDRERLNGQLVLQARLADNLTATFDYTYSSNTVQVRNSNVGVWFNFNDVSSAWTDGPVAGPIFYSERFGAAEGKDLSYSGALTENRSENNSIGGNLKWESDFGLRVELDAHHSNRTVGRKQPLWHQHLGRHGGVRRGAANGELRERPAGHLLHHATPESMR